MAAVGGVKGWIDGLDQTRTSQCGVPGACRLDSGMETCHCRAFLIVTHAPASHIHFATWLAQTGLKASTPLHSLCLVSKLMYPKEVPT